MPEGQSEFKYCKCDCIHDKSTMDQLSLYNICVPEHPLTQRLELSGMARSCRRRATTAGIDCKQDKTRKSATVSRIRVT